jgi:amidase
MAIPHGYRSAFVPHDFAKPIPGAAFGLLAGLTVAVKDMYDIAGERTGGGSPEWLAAQAAAKSTAGAVRKLLDAGATVMGKTVCDEFFYSVTGANAHYGTPLNPRAPGRLPGGSSSGSASAAAAGACDIGLGSDTGGSIRVPAAFCGLFGIRPTHGRIDLSGVMPMAPTFDVPGWMAATPGVFRGAGDVLLEGAPARAELQRVVLLEDAFENVDADIAAFATSTLAATSDELPRKEHQRVAPAGLDPWVEIFRVLQAREVWGIYGKFVTDARPSLGPGIRERMQFASGVSQRDADVARGDLERARQHIRQLTPPGTILALPTTPCSAPPLDAPPTLLAMFRTRVMRLTCIAGLGGLPQVTLPIGTVSGAPAGLSFIGWPRGDEDLLQLAVRLARYLGAAS